MASQSNSSESHDLGQRIDGDDDLILNDSPAIEVTQRLPVEDELSFELPDEQSPLNTASLFEQMERSAEAVEEVYQEETAGSVDGGPTNGGPTNGGNASPFAAPLGAEGGVGDDDIEQYMAGLLQRNNGYSSAPSENKSSGKAAPKSQKADTPERREEDDDRRKWDRRQKPRTIHADNLSNMRELANMNARSAIETHSHRQLMNLMRGHLIVAGVSVAISLTMLSLTTDATSVTYMVSISALLAACTWTCKYLMRTRQLRELNQKQPANESDNTDAKSGSDGADLLEAVVAAN